MSSKNEEAPFPAPGYNQVKSKGFLKWIKNRKNLPEPIQEAVSDFVEETNAANDFITEHERILLSNILKLRELKVVNVMIPRADIVAIDVNTTPEELLGLLGEQQYSRIPVYRDTLDDVLGTIHLKDVVGTLARGEQIDIKSMITDIPIVSPAMTILNLLLKMRQSSRHMAMVVDEYGGIDGLVTVGNVIESIIGEIEDEHTNGDIPQMVSKDDGSVLADARLDITQFEQQFGMILSDEERNSSDTIGGLIYAISGRIPARGEIVTHGSGMIFEILDADPRRINVLRISNIPAKSAAQDK